MAKGIIYIMTTAVSGLIKIGKTRTDQFQERMRNLEANGYYNVVGLKRYFAIELEDYNEKESLLQEIFSKQQIGSGELFALDYDLVRQLLLAFNGKVVYPKNVDKEKEFDEVSAIRRKDNQFTFYKKGMKNGDVITFVNDKSIKAKVVGEREVECNNQIWKLSKLAYYIFESKGELNKSGSYQGAWFFEHNGTRLWNLPDIERS